MRGHTQALPTVSLIQQVLLLHGLVLQVWLWLGEWLLVVLLVLWWLERVVLLLVLGLWHVREAS